MLIIYSILCFISVIMVQPYNKLYSTAIEEKLVNEDINPIVFTNLDNDVTSNEESNINALEFENENKVIRYLKESTPYLLGGIALANYCKFYILF